MPNGRLLISAALSAVILLFLFFPSAKAATDQVTWEQLQKEGAVISDIRIEVRNVFSKDEAGAHYWFARLANAIHVETKDYVVERELPFKIGDRVNAAIIHDAERSLRHVLSISRDAVIEPERMGGNKVRAVVIFKDAWTLAFSIDYGHTGGQSKYRFMIRENNFLGLGKGLKISRQQTFERTINELGYFDSQLFGSKWMLDLDYQQLSDGNSRLVQLRQPFRTYKTPWAFVFKALDFDATLTLYNHTHSAYNMRYRNRSVDLAAMWAYRITSNGAYRLGAGLTSNEMKYSNLISYRSDLLPAPTLEDHRLEGLEMKWQWFDDRYQDFWNLQQIGRTENFNLGWDVSADVGYYSPSLGSADEGPFFYTSAGKGWQPSDNSLFLFKSSASGRRENGLWRDLLMSNEAFFYNQSFPLQTLAGHLRWDWGLRPDPQNLLYLDALEGLRGYPNHFRAGDQRVLLSLEDRIVTDHILWGLLQIGFVGFLDVGSVHGFDPEGWGKTYADAGLGFRLGNIRFHSTNVIQLTVAVPLVKDPDAGSYQIILGNFVQF